MMYDLDRLITKISKSKLPVENRCQIVYGVLSEYGKESYTERFLQLYDGLEQPYMENEKELLDYIGGGSDMIIEAFPEKTVTVGSSYNKGYVVAVFVQNDTDGQYEKVEQTESHEKLEISVLIAFLNMLKKGY